MKREEKRGEERREGRREEREVKRRENRRENRREEKRREKRRETSQEKQIESKDGDHFLEYAVPLAPPVLWLPLEDFQTELCSKVSSVACLCECVRRERTLFQ